MKRRFPFPILRTCCLILAVLITSLCLLCGCSLQKALMTIGDEQLSLNMYELLLSRMKGSLAYSGYPVDEDSFWNQIISEQGATYNDYFCITTQEEAKKMLAKLYLYEQEYTLTLSQNTIAEVDAVLNEILEFEFNGSKAAFNQELAEYGVNMEILRENYIIEEKLEQLTAHISSITSDAARQEYLENNYVCFRQILFPLYEYRYETDENDDVIYYKEGTTRICYDTAGQTKTGTDGKLLTDDHGDVIYFTEDGRIAYNTQKGVPVGLDEDTDGEIDIQPYDEETQQVIFERAKALKELIQAGDFTTFEQYGNEFSADATWDNYPDGIYLNINKVYSIDYLADMQAALRDMQFGDVAIVSSQNAYHLIMKYDMEEQAYANDDLADWFAEFDTEVAEQIIENLCEEHLDKVIVDSDALAEARDMKSIGANLYY